MTSLAKQNYLSELRAFDWNFEGETGNDGLAGYHWYPARYVPQVPGVLLSYFSEPGDLVLDPFCGSGTTLIEGVRQGRRVVGIDTNPVAVMIARAKLVRIEPDEWTRYVRDLRRTVEDTLLLTGDRTSWLKVTVPQYDEQAAWYHHATLEELAAVWDGVRRIGGAYEPVAHLAFSAILRFMCSQGKHWGWICDNVKPKSLVYRPAMKTFFAKLEDFSSLSQALATPGGTHAHRLDVGACAEVLGSWGEAAVDLVVTSPPYFSMTDYVRSQRLTFLWFGWDLDAFRAGESGARYKRHRKQSREQYLSDMASSFGEIARVLKSGGACCVVVGESPNRAPYLDEFRDTMVHAGLRIETRLRRRVATQRSFSPQLRHEEIVIARKEL